MVDDALGFDVDEGNCAVVIKDGELHSVVALGDNVLIFEIKCDCQNVSAVIVENGEPPAFCPMCGAASGGDDDVEEVEEAEGDDA